MNTSVSERKPDNPDNTIVNLTPTPRMDSSDPTRSEEGIDHHARRTIRLVLMLAGIGVVVSAAAFFWYTGGRYASTDDAYIHAAQVSVSTDVSGLVTDILVKEGQTVGEGDLLFRIDPSQYQIALDQAKAALASTALDINSTKADYQATLRTIAAQQSVVDNDQLTFDRYSVLGKDDLSISKAMVDQARLALQGDQQKLASLQQQAQAKLALLNGDPDLPTEQHPRYLQAKAQVDAAQRDLDHTFVKAPFSGIVTRVDSLQPGVFLVAQTAGLTYQGAVGLVSTENMWVDANLKETDLTYVKLGNPVEIKVDTYPDRTWHGVVDSISPASAADFSILPVENASGNWVKVVRRIPVRIRIEHPTDGPDLRSGMSASVRIETGHRRSLKDLF